jgi:hypothetical protein
MRYLWLENGDFNKNALSKIESLCHVFSKDIFKSKIVQVLSEKNIFKFDAAFTIFPSILFFYAFIMTWKRQFNKKNAWSKFDSQFHVDSKLFFELKIVWVLSEKNFFKLDAEFEIKICGPFFRIFWLYAFFTTWKRQLIEKRLK